MNDDLTPQEQRLTRWLDGELSDADAAEFEREMASKPDLRQHSERARKLGDWLRTELSADTDPVNPERFNAQIRQRIEAETASEPMDSTTIVRPPAGVWRHLPWLIAGAAVLVAAILVLDGPDPSTTSTAAIASSDTTINYSPRDGVVVRTRYAAEADATVITLDGLEDLPGDFEIGGALVSSYLPVAPGEAPVFASVTDGRPLFLLLTNASNIPSVVRLPQQAINSAHRQ